MPVRLQNRTCSDYRKGAVMRKPASCVLSIALSLVMTVGFIPSPALAEIASAPEPAAQSAGKPNESPAETTSGQARANDQISAASGTNVTANATQPIDASMFSIEDTDIRYTGNPVMPTVTSSTVPSDQYTVAYENNVAIGQATAVVTADDQNYSGTCAIPFEIKPANAAANYQHSTTAQSGDITLTVQWNDPRLGQETTFHVTATGGSGAYQFRMDAPTYMDPDGSSESVADPSRNQWQQYTGECTSHDYQFEMTASGTYYLRFYLMDKAAGVYYLRSNVFASANDDAYPAVSAIVKSAVDKCSADTDGSDYARALWLHDWTLDHLEYDHGLNWCSAESGLTRHQGTCESYQRIYSKLLDAAGIANGRITGNGHTWNAVKIDGKWCQMDLTWDDTSDNWYGDLDQRHLYFGLTDELMAIAHSDHTSNYQKDDYAYRSTDLSNNFFVRNGKADEWAKKYADRIQQHLDAREESFSIDADNQSFPPSISGIQNGIVAYAMNQREWKAGDAKVELATTSKVTTTSSIQWSAQFVFNVDYIVKPTSYANVTYETHAEILGWMSPVSNGEMGGTVGEGRQLEAVKAYVTSNLPGSLEMSCSAFGREWSSWAEAITGSTGESRALQAIRIKLTGELATEYDVFYCVHVADYGWLGWAKNGESAGTINKGKTLQAIRIYLAKKGSEIPDRTSIASMESEVPSIGYSAHSSYIGWQGQVTNGATAGFTNGGLNLEAIHFGSQDNTEVFMEGNAHVACIGWQTPSTSEIGTTGKSLPIEAVTFRLKGELNRSYHIRYRVHSPYYGWSDWKQDGEVAGTTGRSQATDAVEIMLISK